jgi:hypothetical protein
MTSTELIARLQHIEAEHGVLPVHLEAKCTGVNLMDGGGNVIECYTISLLAEKCEVDGMEDGTTKAVWLMGTVAAEESMSDD